MDWPSMDPFHFGLCLPWNINGGGVKSISTTLFLSLKGGGCFSSIFHLPSYTESADTQTFLCSHLFDTILDWKQE